MPGELLLCAVDALIAVLWVGFLLALTLLLKPAVKTWATEVFPHQRLFFFFFPVFSKSQRSRSKAEREGWAHIFG